MSVKRELLNKLPSEQLMEMCLELELNVDRRSRDALLGALLSDSRVGALWFISRLTNAQLRGALQSLDVSPAVLRWAMEQQAFHLAGDATLLKYRLVYQLDVTGMRLLCDELGLVLNRRSRKAMVVALLAAAGATTKRLIGVLNDEQLRDALAHVNSSPALNRTDMEREALAVRDEVEPIALDPTFGGPALAALVDPKTEGDSEQRAARFAKVEVRSQQSAFRNAVYRACQGRCVVSGCSVPEALEAAHVKGRHWRLGHNSAKDGILLRRDLHALYDRGLLQIDADGLVMLDTSVRRYYVEFEGRAAVCF